MFGLESMGGDHKAKGPGHSRVPAPSTRSPGLSPALDALVAMATSRNPDLRPADAGQFLEPVGDPACLRKRQRAAPRSDPHCERRRSGRTDFCDSLLARDDFLSVHMPAAFGAHKVIELDARDAASFLPGAKRGGYRDRPLS